MTRATYAFGDSDLARERLGLVAATFEGPTRRLLADLPPTAGRYVVDLGCGPGYTSALLRAAFPDGFVTGVDSSATMVADARSRVPGGHFFVGDVTAPLRLPAHVCYARLLLGHLPEPSRALDRWADAVLPGGVVVCEEPVRYRSDDELFARYERAVTSVVAARGATLWAGPVLDADPGGCVRVIDRVVEHPVRAASAAAMFWRNAVSWDGDPDLVEQLRAVENAGNDGVVLWELRQVVWQKAVTTRG